MSSDRQIKILLTSIQVITDLFFIENDGDIYTCIYKMASLVKSHGYKHAIAFIITIVLRGITIVKHCTFEKNTNDNLE